VAMVTRLGDAGRPASVNSTLPFSFLGLTGWYEVLLFWTYIAVWVAQGLLVHWASVVDEEEGVVVDSKVAVMWQEAAKLVLASALFCMDTGGTLAGLVAQLKGHPKLLLLNMIPAALYCIYNVLTYHGLKRFDPGT
ncbi:hypothetical protein FOZ62_013259, partial [Perkinsus olseni]